MLLGGFGTKFCYLNQLLTNLDETNGQGCTTFLAARNRSILSHSLSQHFKSFWPLKIKIALESTVFELQKCFLHIFQS